MFYSLDKVPKTIKKTSQKIQPKLELDDKEVDTIIASIKIDSPVEISSTVNNCHFMTNLIEQKNIDLQAMMRFVNQLNQVLEKDGLQATANIGDLKKLNLTALKVYVQTIELFSHEKILLEQHLRNLRELKKYRAAVYKNIEFSKVESRDSPSPQFGETYIHNIFFRVKSTYLQNENSKKITRLL